MTNDSIVIKYFVVFAYFKEEDLIIILLFKTPILNFWTTQRFPYIIRYKYSRFIIIWVIRSTHLCISDYITLCPPCSPFIYWFFIKFPIHTVWVLSLLAIVNTWKQTFSNLTNETDSILNFSATFITKSFCMFQKLRCSCGFA